jgi:hypothetical protein
MEGTATQYWKVAANYFTSRYIARTHTGSGVYASEVVPEPIPIDGVTVDGFEAVGSATPDEYEAWQQSRLKGVASGADNDEPPDSDEDYEEFGQWGGVLWVARGCMTVVVAASDPDQLELDEVQAYLPTVLEPDDFEGEAQPADWV